MTTYDFTTASLKAPTSCKPTMVSNTAVTTSVLTGAVQTVARPGERWQLELTWTNLNGGDLDDILAFFTRLNGHEHRVKLKMYGFANRGAYGGTPVVNGASQTGSTINISGASLTITDWTKARDYISFDNQIRMVTADADSDGAGLVTIPIWPAIRTSPSNGASVTTANPTGIFILTTPVDVAINAMNRTNGGNNISSISLGFVEDVTA
jgi:hypothetical protein